MKLSCAEKQKVLVAFQALEFQILPWSLSDQLSALLCSVGHFSVPTGPFPPHNLVRVGFLSLEAQSGRGDNFLIQLKGVWRKFPKVAVELSWGIHEREGVLCNCWVPPFPSFMKNLGGGRPLLLKKIAHRGVVNTQYNTEDVL